MTIAAGFCFKDGILLCADTEQTVGQLKINDSKIISENFPDCSIAFAIAGDVAQATSAVQQILADLRECTDSRTVSFIECTIRSRIEDIYQRLLLQHPRANYGDSPFFDLVVAVRSIGESPCLFASSESAVTRIKEYACRGVGLILAGYLIKPLYHKVMSPSEVKAIAAHMMNHVKASVSGCGGSSEILIVDKFGIHPQTPYDVQEYESFAKVIDEDLPMLYWIAADLNNSDEDVDGILDVFRDDIMTQRKLAREAHEKREKRMQVRNKKAALLLGANPSTEVSS